MTTTYDELVCDLNDEAMDSDDPADIRIAMRGVLAKLGPRDAFVVRRIARDLARENERDGESEGEMLEELIAWLERQ